MMGQCSWATCGMCGRCTAKGAPGEGSAHYKPNPKLRCVSCSFTGEFTEAVKHYHATGHQSTYKGTVQDFSRVPQTKKVSAA